MGIDVQNPGLMWNVEGAVRQTAYRILAQTEGETIWDSGKTASSRMTGIRFPHMLASRQRVLWKVKLWDETDGAGTGPKRHSLKWVCWNPWTGAQNGSQAIIG